VVNALSLELEVLIRRNGQLYRIRFENGHKVEDLTVIDTVGKRNTGTCLSFLPNPDYFEPTLLHQPAAPQPPGQGGALPGPDRDVPAGGKR